MGRTLRSIVVATTGLCLAAAVGLTYEATWQQHLGQFSADLGLLSAGIPDPPETPEQAAQAGAAAKSQALLLKAFAKPSTLAFVKTSGKVDKLLRKAWPADGAIGPLLSSMAGGDLALLQGEADRLRSLVVLLPEDPARDALLAAVDVLRTDIDDVPWDGSPASFAPLYSAMTSFAGRLKAAWKKQGKLLAAAAGRRGMTALVNGVPFRPDYLTGNMQQAPWGVKSLHLVANPDDANLVMMLDLIAPEGGLVPGVYTVESGLASGAYDDGEGMVNRRYSFTSATVTLLYLDPATGTAAGTFSATGTDGETEAVVTEGKFRATGITVIQVP